MEANEEKEEIRLSPSHIARVEAIINKNEKEGKVVTREKAMKHYAEWRALPRWQREPRSKTDFAKIYGITLRGLEMWDKKLDNPISPRKIAKYDSTEYLKSRTMEVDEALISSILQHKSPKNIQTFYQLTERKLDEKGKVDIKIDISADAIIGHVLRAEKEIRASGYGSGQMQGESLVLHEKLRLDTGLGTAKDNPLGSVASSGESSGVSPEMARCDTEETDLSDNL